MKKLTIAFLIVLFVTGVCLWVRGSAMLGHRAVADSKPAQIVKAETVVEKSSYLCGAPTTKGTACKNKIKKEGDRCRFHKEK